MKRIFLLLALTTSLLVASLACNQNLLLPPPPPAPSVTPTPTLTSGCQTSGLNILSGSATLGTPYIISLTPVPTTTPTWSWSGSLPPHPGGVTLIQTASDWANYVSNSYTPTGSFPIPFNPATQVLLVVSVEGFCPDTYNLSVCNNGTQITVQVDNHQSCCPTYISIPGIFNTTGFQAVIVNTFGLPVVVHQTYYPWVGPLCA